jgi:purine-cytosine permease-like protein
MLLFSLYFASKIFGLIKSRFPASFWLNVAVTMLILLGPAVEDSANGKDVYAAFFSRMMLFVLVTFYAWAAVALLEHLRLRRKEKNSLDKETVTC